MFFGNQNKKQLQALRLASIESPFGSHVFTKMTEINPFHSKPLIFSWGIESDQ